MFNRKARAVILLVICLTLAYGAFVVHEYEPFTYTYADPGWMVSTVMSLVEDGDLDLRNQLKNDPAQAVDQTSRGKDGQWYPLHEILMPIVTVPFYLLWGINGCLVFNVIISILLMLVVFQLCARHTSLQSAFSATILTALATLFLSYTYSYSLDVFSALLLLVAYWCAVQRRYLLTGFLWGLSVYARFANIVTLLGFAAFICMMVLRESAANSTGRAKTPRLARILPPILFLAGGLPMAICFSMTNWLMFGSPMVTSYDRWQHFVGGQFVVATQREAFACSFLDRLSSVLLDPQAGLLIGAPLMLVALAFGLTTFWRRDVNEATLMLLTCGSLLVLFTKYCNAYAGSYGNRYLMPIVALFAIPLSIAIQKSFDDEDHIVP